FGYLMLHTVLLDGKTIEIRAAIKVDFSTSSASRTASPHASCEAFVFSAEPIPMSYHLLTGATGLLGNYLLRDLLLKDVPVAVLVRPNRKQTARQRIEAALCAWDAELGISLPRPVVMEGDISL